MIKSYKDSIQALRRDEIELVFSILDKRTLSEPVRAALLYRYEHGCSVSWSARRNNVDRTTLSKAENRVLRINQLILEHLER